MKTADIVIPVYNEEQALSPSVNKLRDFLARGELPYRWTIVIADNASTDATLEIAQHLAQKFADVRYIHLDQKGRGRALRRAWTESKADLVCYMDVDLSTGLAALRPLLDSLGEGYDIAIGSRLLPASRTTRGPKREFISRCYNLMIRTMFWNHFADAQCGFKAATRRAVRELVPLVEDQAWFFDTELLLLAEMKGYRIKEVPVEWIDDPDSRVKIVKTATEDVKGLLRMRFRRLPAAPAPAGGDES